MPKIFVNKLYSCFFFKPEVSVLKIFISFSRSKATVLPYKFSRRHSHLVTRVRQVLGLGRPPFWKQPRQFCWAPVKVPFVHARLRQACVLCKRVTVWHVCIICVLCWDVLNVTRSSQLAKTKEGDAWRKSCEVIMLSTMQGVPWGDVNILGSHNIGYSKQKIVCVHVSYSERFPKQSYLNVQPQNCW